MKRKQLFFEVGRGLFAQDSQALFEKCQGLAMESKQAIVMTMKIVIEPPPEGDNFGKTQFSLTHTMPIKKSIKYTTEYEAGHAIGDGESIDGLLQTSLFPEGHPGNQR